MKTELDQLRENAEKQYVQERMGEVKEKLILLCRRYDELTFKNIKWCFIELGAWLAFFVATVVGAGDMIESLAMLLWIGCLVYRWVGIMFRREYLEGKIDGMLDTLITLGIMDEHVDGDKQVKTRQARSPFKRFKEFFERMGSKNTQEAHA